MTLQEKQTEFIELFNSLESWTDRFQFLIDIAPDLPELPEHKRNSSTQVTSCNSRTYFLATIAFGKVSIQGWSNAVIPAGLIALINYLFDGFPVEELRSSKINFHLKTDLINNLTEQRKSGFLEMINRVIRL